MNCTIWRSTSTSAPFSASSASAIVAVVIVCSLQIKVDGSHLNLIRAHDGHPVRVDQPLCGKPLRATPSAPRRAPKDLHHFLGHHRSGHAGQQSRLALVASSATRVVERFCEDTM